MIICQGCNLFSGTKRPGDDSLHYYPPTPAQLGKDEFRHYYRTLRDFFDSSLLDGGFNGGILIAKGGAVIYEKYEGSIDWRKKDTLTSSTSLQIASTSKTFTAVAVLRMVQENKLLLDDSISKFFPAFPYPGITVKMLLNHRSGLPNYVHFIPNSDWDKKKYVTNADVLGLLYSLRPNRSFPPNIHFNYSNTNYVLLSMIIEKISGQSFPEYMLHKFFEPLDMRHTYVFTLKDTLTATPSFGSNGNYWAYDFLDGTYGDKNIYSTPQDLLKWDQALYTDQVIGKSLQDSAFSPYSFEKPSVHNYGLGWRLQILPNGKKIVYHFGKWHGFNSAFARLMDEKVTIIILGNKFTHRIYSAAHFCYDIFGNYQQHRETEEEETDSTESVKKEKTPLPGKRKKSGR